MKLSVEEIAIRTAIVAVGVILGLCAFALWAPDAVKLVG